MTLPVTGPLSLSQVNVELGLASNAPISLGQTTVRTLAGVASGPISISKLRGKSIGTGNRVTVGDGSNSLYGYVAGQYGSISPSTVQGYNIMQLVSSPGFNLGWYLLPYGARLTGTTITYRNASNVVIGTIPLPAPYDDAAVGTYYVFSVNSTFLSPVGAVQYVEIT